MRRLEAVFKPESSYRAFFMASEIGCRVTGIDHSQKLIDISNENRKSACLGDTPMRTAPGRSGLFLLDGGTE